MVSQRLRDNENGEATAAEPDSAYCRQLGADKSLPHPLCIATVAAPNPDLCTTCLLFNESVRRYLLQHYNKFPSCDSLKCRIDIFKQTQSHFVNLPKRPYIQLALISGNGRLQLICYFYLQPCFSLHACSNLWRVKGIVMSLPCFIAINMCIQNNINNSLLYHVTHCFLLLPDLQRIHKLFIFLRVARNLQFHSTAGILNQNDFSSYVLLDEHLLYLAVRSILHYLNAFNLVYYFD